MIYLLYILWSFDTTNPYVKQHYVNTRLKAAVIPVNTRQEKLVLLGCLFAHSEENRPMIITMDIWETYKM